jgi:hypothetical protein
MHILELTETIKKTMDRTVKFNPDGTLGHTLDKDVFNVIAIAIASDILDTYIVKNKDD